MPLVKKITFVLVPGLYGEKVPLGSRENRMQVAVLGEDFENLARLVSEEAVVRAPQRQRGHRVSGSSSRAG